MTNSGWLERIAMRLARVIAGQERRGWLDAMESELDHLRTRRLDWALGSLVAALKDRAVRDWRAAIGFLGLAWAPALAVLPVTALAAMALRALDLPLDLLGPAIAPLPLPFAVLLGALRKWRHPAMAGVLAFAVYQAGPAAFFSLAWGGQLGLWGPNLTAYGIHPALMTLGTLALWCGGVCAGSGIRRTRRHGGLA